MSNKQIVYAIIGGILGGFLGLVVATFGIAALAGMLWLFVFGDNTWPDAAERVLSAIGILILLASIWLGAWIGYRRGAGDLYRALRSR